jgi:hypothetical protein
LSVMYDNQRARFWSRNKLELGLQVVRVDKQRHRFFTFLRKV